MSEEYRSLRWQSEAICAEKQNKHLVEFFFSDVPEEKYQAKNLCFSCPVRKDCVKYALEAKEIWGIWGGRDENEIRRALSVDADGVEYRRGRYPQCLHCSARTSKLFTYSIELPKGGRWTTARMVECSDCGFKWRSRTSANAVNAYHAERKEKKSRASKTSAPSSKESKA